jgi:hypothetical protein
VRIDRDDQCVRVQGRGRDGEGAVTGADVDDDAPVRRVLASASADVQLDQLASLHDPHAESLPRRGRDLPALGGHLAVLVPPASAPMTRRE